MLVVYFLLELSYHHSSDCLPLETTLRSSFLPVYAVMTFPVLLSNLPLNQTSKGRPDSYLSLMYWRTCSHSKRNSKSSSSNSKLLLPIFCSSLDSCWLLSSISEVSIRMRVQLRDKAPRIQARALGKFSVHIRSSHVIRSLALQGWNLFLTTSLNYLLQICLHSVHKAIILFSLAVLPLHQPELWLAPPRKSPKGNGNLLKNLAKIPSQAV